MTMFVQHDALVAFCNLLTVVAGERRRVLRCLYVSMSGYVRGATSKSSPQHLRLCRHYVLVHLHSHRRRRQLERGLLDATTASRATLMTRSWDVAICKSPQVATAWKAEATVQVSALPRIHINDSTTVSPSRSICRAAVQTANV